MSSDDPIDALLDALDREDRDAPAALIVPMAGGVASQPPRSRWRSRKTPAPEVTSSYVGGHAFMPHGQQWPVDQRGEPLHFVVQVNFAEIPASAGFPDRGVLLAGGSDAGTPPGRPPPGVRGARATSSSGSSPQV